MTPKEINNIRYYYYFSKKMVGIGFMLNTDPAFAMREVSFEIDFKFMFVGFWIVKFKN